jgi:hypothetical protein
MQGKALSLGPVFSGRIKEHKRGRRRKNVNTQTNSDSPLSSSQTSDTLSSKQSTNMVLLKETGTSRDKY